MNKISRLGFILNKLCYVVVAFFVMPLILSFNNWNYSSPFMLFADRSIAVKWPLVEVEDTGGPSVFPAQKFLFIQGASNVPLSKLVDLTAFGNFRPGLTIEEAAARFGKPVRVVWTGNGTRAEYDLPNARIEVEDLPSGSSCGGYNRCTVYAYPKSTTGPCGAKASKVLHSSIVSLIPKGTMVELTIGVDKQRVWVLVQNDCVKAMNWI